MVLRYRFTLLLPSFVAHPLPLHSTSDPLYHTSDYPSAPWILHRISSFPCSPGRQVMEVTADGSSYLSDFLEDTDFRLFSRPPTPTNPTEPVLPFSQSGIQLPNEILVTIFDLLWYDAYALLACCSTCLCFKSLIEQRLRSLRERPYFLIDRSGGGNRLREDIQLLSTCARCVGHLHVSVSNQSSLPAIFSAVPFQLSTQLVHLESLTLTVDHDTSSIHPSVWPLFGRTIPRVSRLSLVNMSFPSFNNFVQFVLSFRSLSFLGLGDITTVQHQVRRTHLRRTIRWDVSINTSLCLPRYVPFMKTFAGWVHLNNITFRELHIADYPSFFEFGRQIRACTLEHAELLNINGFISSKDGESR